jgi:hypothetical protein
MTERKEEIHNCVAPKKDRSANLDEDLVTKHETRTGHEEAKEAVQATIKLPRPIDWQRVPKTLLLPSDPNLLFDFISRMDEETGDGEDD